MILKWAHKQMNINLNKGGINITAARIPAGQRVYAIGDVHGRLDLLCALAMAIEQNDTQAPAALSRVILLGDLIDRGPDSKGVIDFVRTWQQQRPLDVLMGNHEERFLTELAGAEPPHARWYAMGGRELLAECGAEPATGWQAIVRRRFGADTIDWLASRSRFHRHGPLVFVHAGIDPSRPLDDQDPHGLLWVRETWWHHPGPYPDDVAVIHGHVPVPAVDLGHPRRLALDTRAHATGVLTALVIHGGRMCTLATRRA